MTLQLTIKSEPELEFAFGKVTQGKEMKYLTAPSTEDEVFRIRFNAPA